MRIEGKVALITGASRGIGAACAAALRRRGARLALLARSEDKLRAVGGAEALILPADLTLPDRARLAVERTLERYGRLDIVINNAGIGLYGASWKSEDLFVRRLFELNFFASLELIRYAVPHMQRQGSGTIVNVSSVAGKVPLPWITLYGATKYALNALTDGLRAELAGSGVHTMSVCPGYVDTDFQQHVLGGVPPGRIARARRFTITAEQCAEAIARGIEADARTIVTPRAAWLLVAVARIAPGFLEKRLAALSAAT